MNTLSWWLWVLAASVFMWCGLLAFLELAVRTLA